MTIVNVATVRSLWDCHHSTLGLLLGISTTGAFTQIVKITVGRPRPDFIDRCQPIPGAKDANPFGLVTAAICTQKDTSMLKDGFRSFFSGHSSLSFAGLGFLSWYLAGKLHLFNRRGDIFRAWIFFAPLAGALLIAISRTMDYRHHWNDVAAGSLVGLALSFFAYRQYFHPLSAPDCHMFTTRHLLPTIPFPETTLQYGQYAYRDMDGDLESPATS